MQELAWAHNRVINGLIRTDHRNDNAFVVKTRFASGPSPRSWPLLQFETAHALELTYIIGD
jgi:hypothetical protein